MQNQIRVVPLCESQSVRRLNNLAPAQLQHAPRYQSHERNNVRQYQPPQLVVSPQQPQRRVEAAETRPEMLKIMNMMREQIEIAANFYRKKAQEQLLGQARQVAALRDKLHQNQRELLRRAAMIQELRAQVDKGKETPKKKINLVSAQQEALTGARIEEIQHRIDCLQQKSEGLQVDSRARNQLQAALNQKMEGIQKGMVKLLGARINSCAYKLDQFMKVKEKQLQNICESLSLLPQPGKVDPTIGQSRSQVANGAVSNEQNSAQEIMKKTQDNVREIFRQQQELRQEIGQFASKQFKYDNYQVRELKERISLLGSQVESLSGALNSLKMVRTTSSRSIHPEKIPPSTLAMSSTIARSQQVVHSNLSVGPEQIRGSQLSRKNELIRNRSTDMLNVSTPNLSFHRHTQHEFHIPKIEPQVGEISQLCRTTSEIRPYTPPRQADTSDICDDDSDEESFQGSSEEEDSTEERLVATIENLKLRMPVLVEIDQTGYLKCVSTSMYLVDDKEDAFELTPEQVEEFQRRGYIRLAGPSKP